MRFPRRAITAIIAAAVALTLAACSSPAAPVATPSPSMVGSSARQITVDGVTRDYRVFVPESLPASVPLVVMLHGGFGSARQAETSYGWNAEATAQRFVVVYPDGLHHAWNVGGGCCGRPAKDGVDDVGFITAVVAAVEAVLPIDRSRVYATGISNGGMMAYRLACDTAVFAGVGPDSATLLGDCPAPHPVSLIHIHGLADSTVRFDGGEGDGRVAIDGPPVPAVIETFRHVNGCPPPAETMNGPVATSIASCPNGRAVELITIADAGHQWPGSRPKSLLQKSLGTDEPSTALDATATIWAFFAAHR